MHTHSYTNQTNEQARIETKTLTFDKEKQLLQ